MKIISIQFCSTKLSLFCLIMTNIFGFSKCIVNIPRGGILKIFILLAKWLIYLLMFILLISEFFFKIIAFLFNLFLMSIIPCLCFIEFEFKLLLFVSLLITNIVITMSYSLFLFITDSLIEFHFLSLKCLLFD